MVNSDSLKAWLTVIQTLKRLGDVPIRMYQCYVLLKLEHFCLKMVPMSGNKEFRKNLFPLEVDRFYHPLIK